MGRGMRFPHFWWCIVLIATAVRGITPDPQDLASLNLLRMICPMLGSELGSQEEDELVGAVCEPLRMDQRSRIRQIVGKIPLPGRIAIITSPEKFSPDARRVASHRNDELWPHGLIHSLGRLRC